MKRIEFNELIEKAFSMGYEMGQKEFGAVKRENKKKKREWLEKLGKEETNYNGQEKVAQGIKDKEYWRQLKKNPFEAFQYIGGPTREQINSVSKTDGNVNAGRHNVKYNHIRSGKETINDVINKRFREKRDSDRDLEIFNKNKIEDIKRAEKYDFILEDSYLKNQLKNKKNKLKEELEKKEKKENLKKAGLALAGTAAVASAVYGAKKLYDKKKKKKEQEEQNKKAED